MEILKQLFEQHFHLPAERVQPLQGQLGGSGRAIVRLTTGNSSAIGILADLSQMHGAELKARWDEMRFLQKHTDHIARMAVVGADKWEEAMALLTAGAAVLEAETRYFDESEILHAWEWVRSAKHAENMPIRQISAGTGIWKDYHPEYMNL